MDVGVHLPQLSFSTTPPEAAQAFAVARLAHALGFAAVAANDHLAFARAWLDGPTLLAAAAEPAGPLQLATTVALPVVRGPAQLAASLAALDALAPGRVVAGLGPGSSAVDYALAGLDVGTRWSAFDEAVPVVRALLRGEELPAAWSRRLAGSVPAAAARVGDIPIWVASWGSAAGLRRVARLGDGWLASAYNTTPAGFARARVRLAAERQSLGLAGLPASVATMWTWITSDSQAAERVLGRLAAMLRRDPASLRESSCIGTPEHCARLLSGYAAAGCQRVYVWPVGDELDQLRRLAGEVLPQVRDA